MEPEAAVAGSPGGDEPRDGGGGHGARRRRTQVAQQAKAFDVSKRNVLRKLAEAVDKSPKGSLDAPIVDLIAHVNGLRDYVTTSSCSGRVSVFAWADEHAASNVSDAAHAGGAAAGSGAETARGAGASADSSGDADAATTSTIARPRPRKGAGEWLLAAHETVAASALVALLKAEALDGRSALLKHEPFIMHVQCRDVPAAQRMLHVAIAAGFRESGIVASPKKTMVAVRTTAGLLEVPLAASGEVLVSDKYVSHLSRSANERFEANAERTHRFFEAVRREFVDEAGAAAPSSAVTTARALDTASRGGGASSKERAVSAPAAPVSVRGPSEAGTFAHHCCGGALAWRPVVPDGIPEATVRRWGHATARVDRHTVLVFGGFGGSGAGTRLNDTLLVDTRAMRWTEVGAPKAEGDATPSGSGGSVSTTSGHSIASGRPPRPQARVRHTATALPRQKRCVLVYGGRANPARPLNDAWIGVVSRADTSGAAETLSWRQASLTCDARHATTDRTADAPPGRWAHSACAVPGDAPGCDESLRGGVVVFGGRDPAGALGDCFVIALRGSLTDGGDAPPQLTWQHVATTGRPPRPRYAHAACLAQSSTSAARLIVHGGYLHTRAPPHGREGSADRDGVASDEASDVDEGVDVMAVHRGASAGEAAHPSGVHDMFCADVCVLDCATLAWSTMDATLPGTMRASHVLLAVRAAQADDSDERGPAFKSDAWRDVALVVGGARPTRVAGTTHGGAVRRLQSPQASPVHVLDVFAGASNSCIVHDLAVEPADKSSAGGADAPWLVKHACFAAFSNEVHRTGTSDGACAALLIAVGGGGELFPFSQHFDGVAVLCLSSALAASGYKPWHDVSQHRGDAGAGTTTTTAPAALAVGSATPVAPFAPTSTSSSTSASPPRTPLPPPSFLLPLDTEATRLCVLAPKRAVKAVKVALEARDALDKTRRIGPYDATTARSPAPALSDVDTARLLALPLLEANAEVAALVAAVPVSRGGAHIDIDGGAAPLLAAMEAALATAGADASLGVVLARVAVPAGRLAAALATRAAPDMIGSAASTSTAKRKASAAAKAAGGRGSTNPAVTLRSALAAYSSRHGVPSDLLDAAPDEGGPPRKIEWVGDVLMLPSKALTDPRWASGTGTWAELWSCVAAAMHSTRVARAARIDPGLKRQSRVQMLFNMHHGTRSTAADTDPDAGGDTWVRLRENGLWYNFDITRVMFSSGNVTEKARMGRMPARGQIVVDLYCGIGYFTIPLLKHAGALHVHACDWNPDAIEAIRRNLADNGVADRCTVHPGDNRRVAGPLRDTADRVMLGLIPTAEAGFPVAASVLKPAGGVMHVHGNVHEDDIASGSWARDVAAAIAGFGVAVGKAWRHRVLHVEKVKSYSPRVYHAVADIEFTAANKSSSIAAGAGAGTAGIGADGDTGSATRWDCGAATTTLLSPQPVSSASPARREATAPPSWPDSAAWGGRELHITEAVATSLMCPPVVTHARR